MRISKEKEAFVAKLDCIQIPTVPRFSTSGWSLIKKTGVGIRINRRRLSTLNDVTTEAHSAHRNGQITSSNAVMGFKRRRQHNDEGNKMRKFFYVGRNKRKKVIG